jgi:hypothetical protein
MGLCLLAMPPGGSLAAQAYDAIVQRNVFGLKPENAALAAAPVSLDATPPKQDLVLVGLFDVAPLWSAAFVIKERGKPPSTFVLRKGEQNEWLEVRSIDGPKQTVTVFLKKPVMRIRKSGTEAVISF